MREANNCTPPCEDTTPTALTGLPCSGCEEGPTAATDGGDDGDGGDGSN